LKAKTGWAPKVIDQWKDQPSRAEHPEFDWMISKILDFRGRGMTGESIAYSWLRRGVQPLQNRVNLGFQYEGAEDPSRMLKGDISHKEIMRRMSRFFVPTVAQPALFEEYSAENPPQGVSELSVFVEVWSFDRVIMMMVL
jgi:hypothetical protein